LPILAQEVGAIGQLEILGERLTKAAGLREHFLLIRYGVPPPKLFRLREDSPSPLLLGFFLSQNGHCISPIRYLVILTDTILRQGPALLPQQLSAIGRVGVRRYRGAWAKNPLQKPFLVRSWRVPPMKLFSLREDSPSPLLPGFFLP